MASRPETVAGYYEELVSACPSCAVVAGDVLDSGSYVRSLERLQAATATTPQIWGLRNYGDATYLRTEGTDAVLAIVPGRIWLEQLGGIVTLRNAAGRETLSTNETRAAQGIDPAFSIAATRPRVTRHASLRLPLGRDASAITSMPAWRVPTGRLGRATGGTSRT